MKQDKDQQESGRRFTSNVPNSKFQSNTIKSTSTNFLTFIPMNLFGQLTNLANIYFIIIAIMQCIPQISVTGGTPTILFPLSIVMLSVLIKDGIEEFSRYRKDKSENQRQVEVFNGTSFATKTWESLQVGEVIKIRRDDLIPCDCLLVSSSDPENKCFVETKGLDGQTNLKIKTTFFANIQMKSSRNSRDSYRESYKEQFDIEVGEPTPYFKDFRGSIMVKGAQVPLSSDNLLLRGCNIRNILQTICICVYTGSDTKLVLNSVKFEPKKSKLMQQVNKLVIEVFIWQLIIALIASLLNTVLENSYGSFMELISQSKFWFLAASWWLMMTYFIPISLMVTMEMVKLLQGMVLAKDQKGFSGDYDCFTNANNTSVNQNLGQIKYVFTDKTGTLTKNEMHFKKLIVNGQLFGEQEDDNSPEMTARISQVNHVSFRDLKFKRKLQNPRIQDTLKVLSLCHDIFVEKEDGKLNYNSSSPDEIALINFAKLYNMELLGEENKIISIREKKNIKKYEKLALLEFNSDRKRMSVIVRDPQTKHIELYCKGADSIVAALLRSGESDLSRTQKYIDELSAQGLRTLLLSKKTLTDSQFNSWNEKYKSAASSINNRQQKIAKLYEEIEKNMQLVGATAIEDRLQNDVIGTIKNMRLAGMSFYILTGDKRETAINIGRSCGLVDRNSKLYNIPDFNETDVQTWRIEMLRLKQIKEEKVFLLDASNKIPPQIPLHQTICYRCTPANKETIVRRVKQSSSFLTLAVGDGANDVNMITAADVGIGVKGKQGTEAARVSDYVVGEFQFIRLLTLYYGREWYRKNSDLVSYCFFKNWYHVSCVIAFGAFTFFSGVVIYDVYLYQLFNVFFTSLPIMIHAIFDEEYNFKQSCEFYDRYEVGIKNQKFNQQVYMKTIGTGIIYGLISLLVVFYFVESTVLSQQGHTGYLVLCGSVLYFTIIMVCNLKLLIMGRGMRPIQLFVVYGSMIVYWLIYYIYAWKMSQPALDTFHLEWSLITIFFVHCIVAFLLVFIELGFAKYDEFYYRYNKGKEVQDQGNALFSFAFGKKK